MNNYSEQLNNPKWANKRYEILKRDDYTCQDCKSKDNELHVHHLTYHKDTDAWDYDNNNLITLCKNCHELRHAYMKMINSFLNKHSCNELKYILDIIQALFDIKADDIQSISMIVNKYFDPLRIENIENLDF